MGRIARCAPSAYQGGVRMYLLFVDESGTHGDESHAFVLGGLAIHEDDATRLQRDLDNVVIKHLERVPVNLEEYEIHAGELRNARKPKGASAGRISVWAAIPRAERLRLLEAAYDLVCEFQPTDSRLPVWSFGVVLDSHFRRGDALIKREQFAYEVLLNKFDVMLKRQRDEQGVRNRGLVIHDRRVVAERDIQSWVTQWRAAAGDVGQLRNMADVPLFTDSRATRLLQAADLVAYALYRRYAVPGDPQYLNRIWPRFHRDAAGQLHGLVHYTPEFGRGACDCESCLSRV